MGISTYELKKKNQTIIYVGTVSKCYELIKKEMEKQTKMLQTKMRKMSNKSEP